MYELVAVFQLILLHDPTQSEIEVAVNKISSLRTPQKKGLLHEDIHCVLHMTNGNFISVTESCRRVHQLILEGVKE